MATTPVPGIESPGPKLVASRWHTVLLIALFLALTLGGAFFQRAAHSQPGTLEQHPHVVPLYLSLIVMEWGLLFYVWKGGLRRSGTKLRELIGGRWRSPKDVAVDAGLALGLWTVWMIVERVRFACGLRYPSVPGFAKKWSFAATSKGNLKCSLAANGLLYSCRLRCSEYPTGTKAWKHV